MPPSRGRRKPPQFVGHQVTRPRVQVEQQIRDAILSGHFAPGEKLPAETRLAEQFGVSRPTVREALGALVSAGLIHKIPGVAGGSFVNSVTAESLSSSLSESVDAILRLGALNVEELTSVREVLEVPAAGLAATHRTRDHLRRLASVLRRQRTTTIDDPEIPEYDRTFHSVIAEASGNRLLSAFVSALHSSTHPATYLQVTPEVAATTVRQHIAIHAAIEARDVHAAEGAMAEHLAYVLQNSTDCSWGSER